MANIGDILTTPESGWVRYDNKHSSVVSTEASETGASGFYNGTVINFNPNKTATFTFTGTAVRVITASYGSGSTISVTIDGISYGTFSTVTTALIYQRLSFEATNLKLGQHVIELKNVGTGYGWIDAFDVTSKQSLYYLTKRDMETAILYGGISSTDIFIESESMTDIITSCKNYSTNLTNIYNKVKDKSPYKILKIKG